MLGLNKTHAFVFSISSDFFSINKLQCIISIEYRLLVHQICNLVPPLFADRGWAGIGKWGDCFFFCVFFVKDGHSHGSMAADCSPFIDMFTLFYTCFSLFLVYPHWHSLGSNLWLHVVQHSLWCCFRTVVFPVLTVEINSQKQGCCDPH